MALDTSLWYGEGVGWKAARICLTPASWLYAAGWQGYRALYSSGIKRAKCPHPRVLCVGNLRVGGAGKTPMCLYLVGLLQKAGIDVILGCSGYGSPRSESATLAPLGKLDPAEWGDEPALYREEFPLLPMVVGRRRVLAAELAFQSRPASVLVMDDGFQHLPLAKAFSILLDGREETNWRCLPAGPYREPSRNKNLADLVLPRDFDMRFSPLEFEGGAPAKAQLLCAIGSGPQFLAAVEQAGVNVVAHRLLGDHNRLDAGTLWDGLDPEIPILVTTKDRVKLNQRVDAHRFDLRTVKRVISIDPEAQFLDALRRGLSI